MESFNNRNKGRERMLATNGTKFVSLGATIFKVLGWVALILQVIIGLILLIGGGPDVPVGGVDIPARLVGVLNFVAAVIYWFMFTFISQVTRLLLDVHAKVAGR
jgi:hypothetical protein